MGNAQSDFENAFDPNKNGLAASAADTKNKIDASVADTKAKIDEAGRQIKNEFTNPDSVLSRSLDPAKNGVRQAFDDLGPEMLRKLDPAQNGVALALAKFGQDVDGAFVHLGERMREQLEKDRAVLETAFAPLKEWSDSCIGNESWWQETMTSPDTYILMAQCMLMVAALVMTGGVAGIGGPLLGALMGVTSSGMQLIADAARGRPIDPTAVASLAMSFLPGAPIGNAIVQAATKSAALGAKVGTTAAKSAAVAAKGAAKAQETMMGKVMNSAKAMIPKDKTECASRAGKVLVNATQTASDAGAVGSLGALPSVTAASHEMPTVDDGNAPFEFDLFAEDFGMGAGGGEEDGGFDLFADGFGVGAGGGGEEEDGEFDLFNMHFGGEEEEEDPSHPETAEEEAQRKANWEEWLVAKAAMDARNASEQEEADRTAQEEAAAQKAQEEEDAMTARMATATAQEKEALLLKTHNELWKVDPNGETPELFDTTWDDARRMEFAVQWPQMKAAVMAERAESDEWKDAWNKSWVEPIVDTLKRAHKRSEDREKATASVAVQQQPTAVKPQEPSSVAAPVTSGTVAAPVKPVNEVQRSMYQASVTPVPVAAAPAVTGAVSGRTPVAGLPPPTQRMYTSSGPIRARQAAIPSQEHRFRLITQPPQKRARK